FAAAPKVLFWQADDRSSVHQMMSHCLIRAYPAFRDAYQSPSRRLFATAGLDELHATSLGDGPGRLRAVRVLLACMAIAVFERNCREIRRSPPPPRLGTPSPLQAHDPGGASRPRPGPLPQEVSP